MTCDGGCVEPVMGPADNESTNNDDDDDDCHQMVMAWTLDDWKVKLSYEVTVHN